jgi:hypothetical protein
MISIRRLWDMTGFAQKVGQIAGVLAGMSSAARSLTTGEYPPPTYSSDLVKHLADLLNIIGSMPLEILQSTIATVIKSIAIHRLVESQRRQTLCSFGVLMSRWDL